MEFLTGHKLNAGIEDIIRNAHKELLIVSPYIKLHERFMEALKTLFDKPSVRVTLLFGKANGDKSTTFTKESIAFFKSLPNIEIAHRQNLHAKFYANESDSIMTSMNLYAYSQDVNIETGYRVNRLSSHQQAVESQDHAWEHFWEIFSGADLMFDKEAQFESKLLGLSKKYTGSSILTDELDETAKPPKSPAQKKRKERSSRASRKKSADDITTVGVESKSKPHKPRQTDTPPGYCIATGAPIPFNIEKPLSYKAFNNWRDWTGADPFSPMKFCHFSGEPSKGRTTVDRPVLNKNWKSAQAELLKG